ncbi:hypothetical protein GH5_02729 [Leishmania sp. Ghana 2012 LV757]|uniref:hypothetical protein n=1 Tax=Leishmania sp. Ghana 2012 LV757 TaxID=2803181 RepID=UPI001B5C0370|nr:hypothetical protein GH5_02729 [Leishmania sp. Ghana 2012 LV757]
MFSAKYYDNPFADDDNDICYAEIVSDGDDSGAAADARSRCAFTPSTTAFSPAWRRTGEAAKIGCGDSTEIPLSTVHGSWRGSDQANNVDYEAYIELLRTELKTANADNNRLTVAQTQLESRVRILSFEKEKAEQQLQQEKERNRALVERVSALEEELELMNARASSAARQRGAASVETSSLQVSTSPDVPRVAAPRAQRRDPNASLQQFMVSDTPLERSPSLELSRSTARHAPSVDGSRSLRALEHLHQAQAAYAASCGGLYGRRSEPVTTTLLQRQCTGYESYSAAPPPPNQQMLRTQQRSAAAQEAIVAQQQTRKEQAAVVRQLEAHLLEHNQQRDELTKQLERLERVRARTVADRKKKAAIERDLEEEEKVIGQIRLELRSYASLLR